MDVARLKTELLCLGARSGSSIDRGRKGGAGPTGGRYFTLPDGTCIEIPLRGRFVEKSPFTLAQIDEKWYVSRGTERLTEVKAVPRPGYYERTTSDGTPMRKVAVLHGKDCLASTIHSRCIHWSYGKQCKFCGIELWHPERLMKKQPFQLGEVAEAAFKEGAANHVTLTIGTPPTWDMGAEMLAEATRAIKSRVNMPVHVQLEPPRNMKALEMLYDAGVDTVGIHIESFDGKVLKDVCPMKTSIERYFAAWKEAVELFGEAQVSTFIIAGLGEADESIIQGAQELARIGVIPYLLPLRPIMGTAFEERRPPTPQRMNQLYGEVCRSLRNYGLDPRGNLAGCVRCGACSSLNEMYSKL